MKKSFWIFLILNLSFAIGQTISGTVTDENGNGLAGANVSVEGTNMGAAANSSGSYTISGVAPGTYTVSASFILVSLSLHIVFQQVYHTQSIVCQVNNQKMLPLFSCYFMQTGTT